MKKLNVGIIGFGMSGKIFHAPIINSINEFNISKIVTKNEEAIKLIKENYNGCEVVGSSDEVIYDKDIDLVIIATPNKTHLNLAKNTLLNDKNVVVEKPFTVTSSEADELIKIAREKNKILSVYQNRRFDSDFRTIKNIVENSLLGNIVEYEAHFDRFRNYLKYNWREENIPGSGILYDLGSHLIDQALYLFGEPKEITADIRNQRECGVNDDYFEIILGYEKLKVTLKAGMLVRESLPHFIVLGHRGSFVKYGMDVQESYLKNGYSPINSENWGVEPEKIWGKLNTDINGLHFVGKIESINGDYRLFYKNIYNVILGNEELIVKPEEARNTIKIIELSFKSSNEKRTVSFK